MPPTGSKTWSASRRVGTSADRQVGRNLGHQGVDLLDVSSGGIHPDQKIRTGPAYQAPFAKAIKEVVGDRLLVGTWEPSPQASRQMTAGGRGWTGDCGANVPEKSSLVWYWADELGVEVQKANQIRWGFGGRGKKKNDETKEKREQKL